jgi:hypothetical protein
MPPDLVAAIRRHWPAATFPEPVAQPTALEAAPTEAPPALDWFLSLLQQAMTGVMAGEAPPVQKANAVARLGSLYLKACQVTELKQAHQELSRRVTDLERQNAELERRLAALQPVTEEAPEVETPVCTNETRLRSNPLLGAKTAPAGGPFLTRSNPLLGAKTAPAGGPFLMGGLGQRLSPAPAGEQAGDIDSGPVTRRPPGPETGRRGKRATQDPGPPPTGTSRSTPSKTAGRPGSSLLPGDLPPRSGPRLSDLLFDRFMDALNQRAAAAPRCSGPCDPTEDQGPT